MKKGPVFYIYYTIKNKRKEKDDSLELCQNNSEIELAQPKEFFDAYFERLNSLNGYNII